ncbi:MAG: PTS lactose/cellobiose transporter subunit IIA [Metamycoplasmataceae bacterium]
MNKIVNKKILSKDKISKAILEMIGGAVVAKKDVLEGIENARNGKFEDAKKNLCDAEKKLIEAEKVHFCLIQKEMSGTYIEHSLLLIHAENEFSNVRTLLRFASEMVLLYKKILAKENKK